MSGVSATTTTTNFQLSRGEAKELLPVIFPFPALKVANFCHLQSIAPSASARQLDLPLALLFPIFSLTSYRVMRMRPLAGATPRLGWHQCQSSRCRQKRGWQIRLGAWQISATIPSARLHELGTANVDQPPTPTAKHQDHDPNDATGAHPGARAQARSGG